MKNERIDHGVFDQGITKVISKSLNLDLTPRILKWNKIASSFLKFDGSVKIAIIGKYVDLKDSYVSVSQAVLHSGAKFSKEIIIDWIDSERLEFSGSNKSGIYDNPKLLECLRKFDGILVPGGFGSRGSEGIINSCNFARVNDIPFLGICFGFQLAIVEYARNVCKLADANSTEINSKTNNPVVLYMPEQKQIKTMGGTMRLGLHNIQIKPGSIASKIYRKHVVQKRHRHRYEFNQEYRDLIESNGMRFTGSSDAGKRIEILEIPGHKFFLGIQYHGEFHSRPGFPEPAFENFIKAAVENKKVTRKLT